MENQKELEETGEVNVEGLSDEEIPSYQLPRNVTSERELITTPASPTFCVVPSSLRSSIQRDNMQTHCASSLIAGSQDNGETKCSTGTDLDQGNPFSSLGMADKDISWVSSMESLVAEITPGKDFNTIEKATFFPDPALCHGSQIQPRALFPTSSSESLFGFHPLDVSLNSDDVTPYSREMRLSDVCDVLRTLNVISDTKSASLRTDDRFDFDVGNPQLGSPCRELSCDVNEEDKMDINPRISVSYDNLLNSTLTTDTARIPDTEQVAVSLAAKPVDHFADADQCSMVFDATQGDLGKQPSTSSFHCTPESPTSGCRSLRCSSPSVFSPATKRCTSSPRQGDAPCPLSPILEATSSENSYLDLALDQTPRFSTPSKKTELEHDEPVHEDEGSETAEPGTGTIKVENNNLAPDGPVRSLETVSLQSVPPSSKPQTGKKCRKKIFYNCPVNVKHFDKTDEEFLKTLKESENISAQFFDDSKCNSFPKTLPKSDNFVSFSHLVNDPTSLVAKKSPISPKNMFDIQPLSAAPSLKRPASDLEINSRCNLIKKGSDRTFATPLVPVEASPLNESRKRPKLDVSPWNSKVQYLVESQAEVSDTQIFQAVEDIESALAAADTQVSASRQSRRKLKLGRKLKSSTDRTVKKLCNLSPARFLEESVPNVKSVEHLKMTSNKAKRMLEDGYDLLCPKREKMDEECSTFEEKNLEAALVVDTQYMSMENCESEYSKITIGEDWTQTPEEFKDLLCGSNRAGKSSTVSSSKLEKRGFVQDLTSCSALKGKDMETRNFELVNSAKIIFSESCKNVKSSEAPSTPIINLSNNCKGEIDSEKLNNMDFEISEEQKSDELLKKHGVSDVANFSGFRTASNKVVDTKPSEAALQRVKNLFADCGDETASDKSVGFKILQEEGSASGGLVSNLQGTSGATNFPGFRTANNKIVSTKPSEAALLRVKNLFADCGEDAGPDRSESFRMVEEEELASDELVNKLQGTSGLANFPGFRTANNKVVSTKPSEAALLRVKNLFSDCGEDAGPDKSESVRMVEEEELASDGLVNKLQGTNGFANFSGFRTANNKAVSTKPSEAALLRVKNLFSDCGEETGVGKSSDLKMPQEEEMSSCGLLKEGGTSGGTSFPGFRTGNNEVANKPSAAALAKATKFFADCGGDIDSCKSNMEDFKVPILQPRFHNSRARPVKSSDVASNADSMNPSMKQGMSDLGSFPDFQLANGSEATLVRDCREVASEESNGEVQLKFPLRDMNSDMNRGVIFPGFRTSNNSIIKIPKDILERRLKMFEDLETCDVHGDSCSEVTKTKPCCCSDDGALMKPSMMALVKDDKPESDELKVDGNRTAAIVPDAADNEEKAAFQPVSKMPENKIVVSAETEGPDPNAHSSRENVSMDGVISSTSEGKKSTEEATAVKGDGIEKKYEQTERMDLSSVPNRTETSSATLEESYCTLLESSDWDEDVPPSWLPSSRPGANLKDKDRGGGLALSASHFDDATEAIVSEEVRDKRAKAREAQTRLPKEKGEVRPQPGAHFLRNKEDLLGWRDAVPEGPEALDRHQLLDLGVREFVLNVTATSAKEFRFYAKHFYCPSEYECNTDGLLVGDGFLLILDDKHRAGAEEVERAFLAGPGVAPGLVPRGWVAHHYSLLVWKLACYEWSCPRHMMGRALTPHNLMLQLKYRYDREVDKSQSSALKRILERDDPAGKALVLTVMRVNKLVEGYELLLTDGWYTCPARPDSALDGAIACGKLQVGTKLMTQGAELMGCEQGVPPLEMPAGAYLKISTNSTRRVRWYHKLGFQRLRCPPPVPLTSILPGGGTVCCVRVAIARVYPLVYVEKTPDGRNVTRNARAEEKASVAFQRQQEAQMDKLYSQIQQEMTTKLRLKPRKRVSVLTPEAIAAISSPEELCSILESSAEPGHFEPLLSDEQKESLLRYQERRQVRAEEDLREKMKAAQVLPRSVRSVLRVRVVSLESGANGESDRRDDRSALLSWWQPPEELLSIFVEGRALSLFNINPGNSRNQLYLNSTRQSRVEPLPGTRCQAVPARTVLRPSDISPDFTSTLGELDIVGLVVYVHEITGGSSALQTVYLTDTGHDFVGLVFWRGLQEFCCEDTLAEGLVVAASNVQWRRSSAAGAIPCGHVTETTLFAHNSKSPSIQSALEELKAELEDEDIPALIERCQNSIATRLYTYKHNPNTSLNSSANTSVGAVPDTSVDTSVEAAGSSPHPRPRYLNGFAQRPRAASTPVKPRTSVQWRLQKLEQVGQPPPLSPISIQSSARLSRAFKLPTIDSSLMEL